MTAPLPPAYLFINVMCHLLHSQEGRSRQVKQLQSRPSIDQLGGGGGMGGSVQGVKMLHSEYICGISETEEPFTG